MPTAKTKAVNKSDTSVTLAETVVDRVNRLHEEARSDAISAVTKALDIGEILIEVKATLKHGEFKKWIEDNCKFAYDTGKRYMKAVKAKSDGIPFSSLTALYGPRTDKGDANERDQKDAEREKPTLSKVEADIVELNNGLEKMQLPVTTAELFVAEAGDAFLSEKAAKRLEWLVHLFDALTNTQDLPGK